MENFSVIKVKARIHISPYDFIVMHGDWSFLVAFFSSSLPSSKGLEMTGPVCISENRNMSVVRELVVASIPNSINHTVVSFFILRIFVKYEILGILPEFALFKSPCS